LSDWQFLYAIVLVEFIPFAIHARSRSLFLVICLSLNQLSGIQKIGDMGNGGERASGRFFRQPDPSAFYSEKLHRALLLEQGVEHTVVVYQYHYHNNHYEEALRTRTAVVYRDDAIHVTRGG